MKKTILLTILIQVCSFFYSNIAVAKQSGCSLAIQNLIYSSIDAEFDHSEVFDSACKWHPTNKNQLLSSIIIDIYHGDTDFPNKILVVSIIDVSNKKREILAKYEIFLSEYEAQNISKNKMWLDIAPYMLTDTVRAVGVRLGFNTESHSCVFTDSRDDKLSLFVIDDKKLIPVLNSLPMSYNMNRGDSFCSSNHTNSKKRIREEGKSSIQILPAKSNGYNNLRIVTKSKVIHYPEHGKQKLLYEKRYINDLKFNGEVYEQGDVIPSPEFYDPVNLKLHVEERDENNNLIHPLNFEKNIYTLVVDDKSDLAKKELTSHYALTTKAAENYIKRIKDNIKKSPSKRQIKFYDSKFEHHVRLLINKPEGILYNHHVSYIEYLNLNYSISFLSGIEHFAQLKNLNLSSSKVNNLKPLANLKYLETLNANKLKLKKGKDKLDGLANLTSLKRLSLANDSIWYIDALAKLTNLEYLNLGFAKTNKYAPHVENNISDLSPLTNLTKLKELKLNGNKITDVSALKGLTELQNLDLNDNEIMDVSALSYLSKLKTLELSKNKIVSISALKPLNHLETFSVIQNFIGNYNEILAFSKVKNFTYSSNPAANSSVQNAAKENNTEKLKEILRGKFRLRDEKVLKTVSANIFEGISNPIKTDNEVIIFPNASIEYTVRKALKKKQGGITSSDLAKIVELDLSVRRAYYGAQEVDFLQYCTNLEKLKLKYHPLKSLLPLQGLTKLKELDLTGVKPSKKSNSTLSQLAKDSYYAPLSRLINMEKLTVNYSDVKDLSFIVDMKKLEKLYVKGKRKKSGLLSNISILESMSHLKEVNLEYNKIAGSFSLNSLGNLTELNLRGNSLKQLSLAKEQTNLKKIDLEGNKIQDISFINKLPKLTRINLNSNNVHHIPNLKNAKRLSNLELGNNHIEDIEELGSLTRLNRIILSKNAISDASVLSKFSKLSSIMLMGNKVSDLSFLSGHTHLIELGLSNNKLKNLEALQNIENIQILVLINSGIKDISFLKSNKNINTLFLSGNEIEDLSPLGDLDQIVALRVDNNNISDKNMLQYIYRIQEQYPGNDLDFSANPVCTLRGIICLSNHMFNFKFSD
ncbi:leucine-rich repeat domain-containing protein [Psychromonas algicola]|uniref:leucine-rich repeat domain-containing protein n=1 Tax=Psychromonas algicola TaxID=2555642 RepID=UPI001067FBEE|nr:leucine-rich repeat protein [Psychromonas sp. RZ5]TEW48491.1 leucine-rich repeat domain-containing protein [Psychromonas sp. RZ5]